MYRKLLAVLLTCAMMLSGLAAVAGQAPSGPDVAVSLGRGTTPNNDSEPNNDFGNATTITGSTTFGGGCGMGDSADYYKIWLNTGASADNLTLTLVLNVGMTLVRIYDPTKILLLEDGPGSPGATLKLSFTAFVSGWYFIWAKDFGPCNYTLTTLIVQQAFTGDGDNDIANATNLDTAGYPYLKVSTLNNGTDIHDYYKVRLNYTQDVSMDVLKVTLLVPQNPTTCQFDAQIYLSGNETPQGGSEFNSAGLNLTFTFSYPLTSDFYLRVWGSRGAGQYTLMVKKFTGYADQNDVLASAAELAKTAPHWYNTTGDLAYGIDQDDYYQISNVVKGQVFNGTVTCTNFDAADTTPKIRINMVNNTGADVPPDPADNLANPVAESNAASNDDGKMYIRLNLTEWAGGYSLDVRTNSPPVVDNPILNISFPENTTNTTIKLAQVFSDAEGDSLDFTYTLYDALVGNLTVAIATDANKTVTLTPRAGWKGVGWMEWTATDPDGASITTPVKQLLVFGVNHKPQVINPTPDRVLLLKNIPDDTKLDMYDIFADQDGEKLQFAATGNVSIRVSFPPDPMNNYWPTGAVMLVPGAGFIGVELVTFTAKDEGTPPYTSDSVTVEIEVMDNFVEKINVKADVKVTMAEDGTDTSLNLNSCINSTAATDNFAWAYLPTNGTHLTVTAAIDGKVTIAPTANWYGTEIIKFRGTCNHNMTGNLSITVEVTPVNDEPVINSFAPNSLSASISEGQSVVFRINATDTETTAAQLKIKWTVDGVTVSSIAEYNFTTNFDTVTGATSKTFRVNVTVNDTVTQVLHNWSVTVNNVNRAPSKPLIPTPLPGAAYEVGQKVPFMALSTDEDLDTLTYTWTEKTKTLGTGALFNYSKLGVGKHNITLTVSDGTNSTTAYILVTIKAKPSPGFEGLLVMAATGLVLLGVAMRRRRDQ